MIDRRTAALKNLKMRAATYVDHLRMDLELMRQHLSEAQQLLRELEGAVRDVVDEDPPSVDLDEIDLGF